MKHSYVPLLGFFLSLNSFNANAQQLMSTAGGDTSGVVWVIGEVVGGCHQADNLNVFQGILANEEFTKPVGLDELESTGDIVIWPNPVVDYVNIRTFKSDFPLIVYIYSLAGILITSFVLQSDQTSYLLSSLASGMYYLKLTDSNNRLLETQKIIKL